MKPQENISLRPYHTFHSPVQAKLFAVVENVEEIIGLYKDFPDERKLVLGEGSNVLFLSDFFDGLVIINNVKGKTVLVENEEFVELAVAGGENWHELVTWTVQQGWGGIENLALIPGKAGTAPIQNIGAYGVELKDVIKRCYTIHLETFRVKVFEKPECAFGYRNSFFKKPENKGKFFIFRIDLELKKNHVPNTTYGSLKKYLEEKDIVQPSIVDVYQAVCEIRRSKLPDPDEVGNAGSFFKNPIIDTKHFQSLQQKFPEMPFYRISEEKYKIPAGWLIEKAGFKGMRRGDAGVHPKQALVLVNYGNATGREIYDLSEEIKEKVKEMSGIDLEREVNIIK